MDLTIIYLIVLITVVIIAVVFLTIFQGRANHNVHLLLKEITELKKEIKSIGQAAGSNIVNSTEILPPDTTPLINKPKIREKKDAIIETIRQKTQNVQVEELVGGSIVSSIGIGLFAMGISFFVKYAIDMQWINDVGRVSLALTASCILVLIAYALNKNYHTFSSVILGGAMAVLFYSFSIAHYQYHLFGREIALIILLLLTAFTTFISIAYKRPELASLIALASFTAPFVAGFGFEKPLLLFSYILILNIGMLIVAYYKKWLIINMITSIFTTLFYAVWLVKIYLDTDRPPFKGAFIFLTIFYLIFFVMFIANNIRKEKRFIPLELSIVIFDNLLYYTAGLLIIERLGVQYKGLFTLLITIFNLLFFIILYRNKKVDNGLLYLIFGLALVFITLTPPVELVGKSITLIWSLQIVLLLWLAQKIDVLLMRLGALGITSLLLLSLGLDMHKFYVSASILSEPMPIFINIGFLTNIMATIGLSANVILLGGEKREYFLPFIKAKYLQIFIGICAAVAFYLTFYLELKYFLFQHYRFDAQRNIVLGIFNIALLTIPAIVSVIVRKPILRLTGIFASFISFLLFFTYFHFENVRVRNYFLESFSIETSNFNYHYIQGALIILALLIGLFTHKRRGKENRLPNILLFYIQAALLTIVISTEFLNMLIVKLYDGHLLPAQIAADNILFPLTLLFISLSAFFMFSGAIFKIKDMRNLSLLIAFVALLKFFIYDYSHITKQQEIITYIILGTVIVVDAFIYQVRKKKVSSSTEQKVTI